MTTTKAHRVQNLIRHVMLEDASPKKRAVIKLLKWQPLAVRIRFNGRCHCRGQYMLSYQTAADHDRGLHEETCGYYCPTCGFGNAGSRPKRIKPNELGTEDTSR